MRLFAAEKSILRFIDRLRSVLRHAPERVEKVDTLLDGNAVRSEINDFRTALPTLAVPEKNLRLERVFFSTAAP